MYDSQPSTVYADTVANLPDPTTCPGWTGMVGGSAPFTIYISDGAAWRLVSVT